MKSSIIQAFLLYFLCFLSGTLCYTSEDCSSLDFDERDLNDLEFFEICGKNRVYDNECPSNNCSCTINNFHAREEFFKVNQIYSNSTRRA